VLLLSAGFLFKKKRRKTLNPNAKVSMSTAIVVTGLQHNLQSSTSGIVMRFTGNFKVAKGVGQKSQVVIYFFYDAGRGTKGARIGSFNQQFATSDGYAATGTPLLNVSNGANTSWWAVMQYMSLNIRRGSYHYGVYHPITSYIVAEAILFVDGVAVKASPLIRIYVTI
jgi:hypothetical protein